MRFTLTPRSPNAVAMRSCVSGRPRGFPEILVAIAWASKEPIQIGRYRSASFSLRITRCWAVGMWIRMLSTETSMRFFIRDHITTSARQGHPVKREYGLVESGSPAGANLFFCLSWQPAQEGAMLYLERRDRDGMTKRGRPMSM